jgi:hypothetical protein
MRGSEFLEHIRHESRETGDALLRLSYGLHHGADGLLWSKGLGLLLWLIP